MDIRYPSVSNPLAGGASTVTVVVTVTTCTQDSGTADAGAVNRLDPVCAGSSIDPEEGEAVVAAPSFGELDCVEGADAALDAFTVEFPIIVGPSDEGG